MDAGAINSAGLGAVSAPPRDIESGRITRVAQEFEALVVKELLAPLFNSVKTPGLAGGGPSEEAFASLLQDEYAKSIAARGGFGIADQVKAALINMQSARTASPLQEGAY
ncbi:MAG: rod-binding protein [Parvularculaceae bacterium]